MKLKFAALAIVASLFAAGTTATAGPGTSTTWTYYSDDTYTQEVGYRIFTCQGRTIRSGVETPYSLVTDEQACW